MLDRTGNMSVVYFDHVKRQREIDKAEQQMRQVMANAKPLEAEIVPGAPVGWYLVHTRAGRDLHALRWLAKRMFGVFRPMQQRKTPSWEGQSIGMMEPIFPGWLFVFVLGMTRAQRDKISVCPGVLDLLRDPASGEPVLISDDFIAELRAQSWVYNQRLGYAGTTARRHENRLRQVRPPRPLKLGRKERKTIEKLKKALKVSGKFEPSTWANAAELAPAKRIALLLQALRGPAVEGGAVGA